MIKAVPITLVSNPTSAILDRPAGVFRTHNEMNHREILSLFDLHKKVTPTVRDGVPDQSEVIGILVSH
jgi:hypothetical protein